MPPGSRFGASKFRNAVPAVPGREEWYRSQLPSASSSSSTSSSTSTFSSEVKSTRRWIVTATPSGDVSWRSYASPAGEGEDVGSMKLGAGTVGDWDVSKLDDETLVIGGTDGMVHVYRLPRTAREQPESIHSFKVGSAITNISLHPTTPCILLVSAVQAPLAIYDISSPSAPPEPAITLKVDGEPKGLWSCGWSPDGRQVAAFGKSGKAYVFAQPRQSSEPNVIKAISSIQPLKPVRVVWVDDKLFVTGTDRSRNRVYALLASTDLSTIFSQNVDTNLAPLVSVVDQERKIIYLSGRGDMSVRQVELGGVTGFQETVHPLPHPLASTSIAAAHPAHWQVMQAEIGRLLLPVVDKDGDALLPLGIKVPRRQLIDYHDDLYPEISSSHPEQTAEEWIAGGDAAPLPISLDPARRSEWENQPEAKAAKPTSTNGDTQKQAIPTKQTDAEAPAPAPARALASDQPNSQEEAATPPPKRDNVADAGTAQPQRSDQSSSKPSEPAAPQVVTTKPDGETGKAPLTPTNASSGLKGDNDRHLSAPATTPAPSTSTSTPTPSGERYNPGWSRKFLSGKSPLNPTYDTLPPLSSLHQDSLIFKITPHLAFFPVQGPGGRLGVHPLKKKGRMVTGGEGYLSGGVEIADFDIEPFYSSSGGDEQVRVALAGEDGLVRIWSVGTDGIKGVGPEAAQVLKSPGIDKIATIAFHPTIKDFLSVLSNDAGSAFIRLFNLGSSDAEVRKVQLDLDGAFNMIWSPRGDRVAISSKDSRIVVLDPRQPDRVISGPAHDSPRSMQIAWIDDTHLVSVGFSKGSQRRINLYAISADASTIETISSTLIDISPSVLFPVYDPDTSILYVWGKGERQIMAYELHPDQKGQEIAKLPGYTASSGSPQLGVAFFPKPTVDVKKVEVAKCLRLTAKSIEEVSFTIPRNKPDFFQDDIYVEILDVGRPVASSLQDWLAGKDAERTYISLKPEGMTPLSQAPKTDTAAKKKFVPAANVMSEQEKKRKEMDDLFRKAKLDESSDEDDEPKRTGLDPPDDDW